MKVILKSEYLFIGSFFLHHGVNLLPDLPILGSSNSAANKDTMSKIWTNWDTVI